MRTDSVMTSPRPSLVGKVVVGHLTALQEGETSAYEAWLRGRQHAVWSQKSPGG